MMLVLAPVAVLLLLMLMERLETAMLTPNQPEPTHGAREQH